MHEIHSVPEESIMACLVGRVGELVPAEFNVAS